MGFLNGKRALICGVANKYSIALGVAKAMKAQGAELAFTYQSERLKENVEPIAKELGSDIVLPCEVADDASIAAMYELLAKRWDKFDILVHSIAYAPADQLKGRYLDCVTREGFRISHDISSYSFAALAKAARPMLRPNGALITMSYLGAVKSLPNYNVMGVAKASLEANVRFMAFDLGADGVRVNGISAGPIKTLASSGVGGLRKMLDYVKTVTPLKRNVTQEEVGNTAAFLCSDLASGITGEIVYVDCGYSQVGMTLDE
jgi:enoyl-[acyl-carrier protein] reductase I